MKSQSPSSLLRQFVELTIRTLDRRSRQFRNTVMVIVIVSFMSVIVSFVSHSLKPLTGFFLLPLVVNAFIIMDGHIIGSWRACLVESWARGELDFSQFIQVVSTNKALPQRTVDSMLGLLPTQSLSTIKGDICFRQVIADTATSIDKHQMVRSGVFFWGNVFFSIPIVLALLTWSWQPLFAVGFIIIVSTVHFFLLIAAFGGRGNAI